MIDWTISFGNLVVVIITILGWVGLAIGNYIFIRLSIEKLAYVIETHGGRLINVENEMRQITDLLKEVAVQDEKLNNITRRIDDQQKAADESRAWFRRRLDEVENDLKHVNSRPRA